MQQVADWLQKLGLGQYAQSFAENDIDFGVLTDLTDQDLEKIGVTSLGHRRKLLRAIVELNRVENEAAKPISAPAAPVAPHDAADDAAGGPLRDRQRACAREALLQGLAVLGQVEAFDLVLLADPEREEEGYGFEQNVSERAGPDEDGDHGINLDQDLPGVALEQARGAFRRVRARR